MKYVLLILVPALCVIAVYEFGSGLIDEQHLHSLRRSWAEPSVFTREDVINRQQLYEGKEIRVLYNHKPLLQGDLLIIPKRAVARLEDVSPSEWAEMKVVIDKMQKAFPAAYDTSDYMLVLQNGLYAGQTVPHVHFHMLPRNGQSIVLVKLKLWIEIITEALGLRQPLPDDEQEREIKHLQENIQG